MSGTGYLATPPSGMLSAIVWKEVRQYILGAVFLALAMTAALVFALRAQLAPFLEGYSSYEESFYIFWVTLLGAPVVGLCLGLVQILPENRGDAWGFLAHRPARRSTLFWGKVTAGFILYAIAAAIPLAGAILWIALPGHLPIPFDWRITLQGVVDLLSGLVYYFAAFLTGMRNARWHGSRTLGVGAAIVCSFFMAVVQSFWVALLIVGAGILVLGVAAWGSFNSGGRYEPQSRHARSAAGVSLVTGLLLVGFIAVSIITSFTTPSIGDGYSRYIVTRDGMLVRAVRESNQIVEVLDRDGKPIDEYRDKAARQGLAQGVISVSMYLDNRVRRTYGYRSTHPLFVRLPFSLDSSGRESWYYVHRLQRIAAYSNRSARLIGWMGPEGFVSGSQPVRPFEGPLLEMHTDVSNWPPLLAFLDAVYRLDLEDRRIDKIFAPQAGESVVAVATPGLNFEVIRTTRRLIVQSSDGKLLVNAPWGGTSDDFQLIVDRALKAPGQPILVRYTPWEPLDPQPPHRVVKYGADSQVLEEFSLPPLPDTERIRTKTFALPTVLTPLAIPVAAGLHARLYGLSSAQQELAWVWVLPALASLATAILIFIRGRKYAFSPGRLRLWTLLGILLGPVSYVLMHSLLDWPALEDCPGCSRKRVVTSEYCEHCRAPFTSPLADGTEIFESPR